MESNGISNEQGAASTPVQSQLSTASFSVTAPSAAGSNNTPEFSYFDRLSPQPGSDFESMMRDRPGPSSPRRLVKDIFSRVQGASSPGQNGGQQSVRPSYQATVTYGTSTGNFNQPAFSQGAPSQFGGHQTVRVQMPSRDPSLQFEHGLNSTYNKNGFRLPLPRYDPVMRDVSAIQQPYGGMSNINRAGQNQFRGRIIFEGQGEVGHSPYGSQMHLQDFTQPPYPRMAPGAQSGTIPDYTLPTFNQPISVNGARTVVRPNQVSDNSLPAPHGGAALPYDPIHDNNWTAVRGPRVVADQLPNLSYEGGYDMHAGKFIGGNQHYSVDSVVDGLLRQPGDVADMDAVEQMPPLAPGGTVVASAADPGEVISDTTSASDENHDQSNAGPVPAGCMRTIGGRIRRIKQNVELEGAPRTNVALPQCEMSAVEILTFFPHHTQWPGVLFRLIGNGWKTADIAKAQVFARGLLDEDGLAASRRNASLRHQVLTNGKHAFGINKFNLTRNAALVTPTTNYSMAGYLPRPHAGVPPHQIVLLDHKLIDLAKDVFNMPEP
ncbi:hypothetical protein BAUCODRAFT_24149 [Baudoinia panamericana UAMH 10762]|uniref:Uncharacterized protein n=1 Tax=Baudoinia panamericana (strain UAMH 10762) TaxID=717646 RepID=M2NB26_BAUPA|nr:uncharacterized protein BAUCODRAFT_24149 [Baudoinia panamericana UAMH 10762]EMC96354.1 hypothetical protein BAUCODRAFT_24149 [Baudoinia panamericana UAMH 10762]